MKNLLGRIPATIKNSVILAFGIILLVYTMGFFKDSLEKPLSLMAIIMILYGFIELDGPAKILSLFSKNNSTPSQSHKDSYEKDDDLF